MDPFTLWEKTPRHDWQPLMTYPALSDARAGLDAWAEEYLAEWGELPAPGRHYRLTEDHPFEPRLEHLPPARGHSLPRRHDTPPPPLRLTVLS